MDTIGANMQAVKARIARAAAACGRDPREIELIAVSKTVPPARIAQAQAAGQTAFGESYVQEAVAKIAALRDSPCAPATSWHFLGPIQSNKTRPIAENFSWVHSVDRLKIAERLSAARPEGEPPLQICIEINIGGEASKHGVAPRATADLAREIGRLPRLELRGLMAVPPASAAPAEQRRYFAALRELKDGLCAVGIALDTLSMGMSDDFEAAIAEGATMVRVGTAIFGERSPSSRA
jgi:pyridoxal phosphate enzyme (YggS family)